MVFSESAPAGFSFFVTPRAPLGLTFKQTNRRTQFEPAVDEYGWLVSGL